MTLNERADLPEPLVACADIRHLPWMQLHVSLLLNDPWFMAATPTAAWGMVKLMAVSWHQVPAGSLPNDPRYMWDIARIRDPKGLVKTAIRQQWVLCSDGRLYHPEVAKVVVAALGNPEKTKRKKGGSLSARNDAEEKRREDNTTSHFSRMGP